MILSLLLLTACPNDSKPDDTAPPQDTGPVVHIEESSGCDDLVPLACALPFPSDRFLTADPSKVTGYRLDYTLDVLPEGTEDFDFAPFQRLDGASPTPVIMTMFDRPADLSDAAWYESIDRSTAAGSPTVILDLANGSRIAHWVENDARATDPSETILYLRLVSRLQENHAYAVIIRDMADMDGVPFEPSPAFAALRDDTRTDSPILEARRPSYEALFATATAAGIERSTIQQAWWFQTASGEALRGDMLAMRADAIARIGDQGLGCTVTEVDDDYMGTLYRRVIGTYTVPSYMDSPDPPASLVRDADGRPVFVENVEVPFTAIIPYSLTDSGKPGPLTTFGHGLMGNGRSYMDMSAIQNSAQASASVIVATDWAGMSEGDAGTLASALMDASQFYKVAERLEQGMVNQITLTRTMAGTCRNDPAFQAHGASVIDPEQLYYVGVSQGGILGATFLTLSPDIQRGVLLVNGAVFSFMIERSIDYAPYYPLLEAAYPKRLDQALLLPMAQHLWDFTDPNSYLPYMIPGLEDIGPKEALSLVVVNDAQVPNLSTDLAMRMTGVPVIEGSARTPWGFDVVKPPYQGSGMLFIDMGDPAVPTGNTFPAKNMGGHYLMPDTDIARSVMIPYLYTGQIQVPCDGICDPD